MACRQQAGRGLRCRIPARWLALLTGLLALGVGSAYGQTCGSRFVAKTGDDMGGTNDCLTNPCLTIQHAVDVVAAGPCPGDTVNVAAGTYTEQVTIETVLNLVGTGATIQVPAPPLTGSHDIVTIGQRRTSS